MQGLGYIDEVMSPMKAGEHGNEEGAAVAGARAFAIHSELTVSQ